MAVARGILNSWPPEPWLVSRKGLVWSAEGEEGWDGGDLKFENSRGRREDLAGGQVKVKLCLGSCLLPRGK